MEVLSGKTLADALNFCDQNPGAEVGVACSTCEAARCLIDSIWEELSSGRMPGWEMGRSVTGVSEATLRRRLKPQPSYIEIFAPHTQSETAGRAFHRILYDVHMSDYWVQELACAERLTFPGEEETSDELDEFLSSFKIV